MDDANSLKIELLARLVEAQVSLRILTKQVEDIETQAYKIFGLEQGPPSTSGAAAKERSLSSKEDQQRFAKKRRIHDQASTETLILGEMQNYHDPIKEEERDVSTLPDTVIS